MKMNEINKFPNEKYRRRPVGMLQNLLQCIYALVIQRELAV